MKLLLLPLLLLIGGTLSSGPPPPRFPESQIARGAEVFVNQCASCHGAGGDEMVDHGPPLSDERFWEVWSGRSMRSLYSRIISTMPASEPGILEPQDVLDVTAYLSGVEAAGDVQVTDPDALNDVPLRAPAF
jgi:mono/diheme cytochrome c family protein